MRPVDGATYSDRGRRDGQALVQIHDHLRGELAQLRDLVEQVVHGNRDVGEVRYAAGAGVRWQSPLGPIRIEFGVPLNKKKHDKTALVLFSFGAPL